MAESEASPVQLEYREMVTHPTGVFPAVVIGHEGRSGVYGPRIRWELNTGMVSPNGDQIPPLSFWTGTNSGPKTKLAQLISDLGLQPPRSQGEARSFNLKSVWGRECLVQVEHVERDGTTWANITKVMPPLKTRRPMPDAETDDPFAKE